MSNEEKIILMLEGLGSRIDGLTGKVDGLTSKVEWMSDDLEELSDTVKKQGEILENLVSKVEKLEDRMDRLEDRMDKLEENQVKLEQLVVSTKEVVVLLETEQAQRIGSLFDADSRLYDTVKKALAEVSKVEPRLDFYGIDIMKLLSEQADMKYKLNKLLRLHENELNIA